MAKSPSAVLRLQSDLRQISTDPPQGCSASPASDSNIFVWRASIFGPPDSAWVRPRCQAQGNASVIADSRLFLQPHPRFPGPSSPVSLSCTVMVAAVPPLLSSLKDCGVTIPVWARSLLVSLLAAPSLHLKGSVCTLRAGRRDLLVETDLLRGERCCQEYAVVLYKLPNPLSTATSSS